MLTCSNVSNYDVPVTSPKPLATATVATAATDTAIASISPTDSTSLSMTSDPPAAGLVEEASDPDSRGRLMEATAAFVAVALFPVCGCGGGVGGTPEAVRLLRWLRIATAAKLMMTRCQVKGGYVSGGRGEGVATAGRSIRLRGSEKLKTGHAMVPAAYVVAVTM